MNFIKKEVELLFSITLKYTKTFRSDRSTKTYDISTNLKRKFPTEISGSKKQAYPGKRKCMVALTSTL